METGTPERLARDEAIARDLPMRDGNTESLLAICPGILARDLPMRDGNYPSLSVPVSHPFWPAIDLPRKPRTQIYAPNLPFS